MRIRLPVFVAALCLLAPPALAQTGEQTMSTHHVQRIDIQMSNFAFTPNKIELLAGSEYELHFVNAASSGHDFASPDFFTAVTVAPADAAKVSDGEIEVEGGQTVDVRITANKPGTYKFRCTHFLHASFGMMGEAVIQ
jgi:plastocyanin